LRVITEFVKRRDVRMVNVFVTAFVPIGCFARAISPLVNTTLDLTTASTIVRVHGSKAARRPDPYRSENKGDSSSWNWCEVLREDNPVSVVVLKPRHIDGLLDDRVSIWVMRSPANVSFLHAEGG